jgi:hypothetical protein
MARPFLILAFLIIMPPTPLAHSAPPPADVASPVKALVHLFYDRVAQGRAKDNEELFLKRDMPITGFEVRRPNDRPFFQKTPADYLKTFSSEPKYFVVDRIDVDRIHDHLAVARVEWKTGGYRGHSVITWSNDGKEWRIVGFFVDQHFVW